MSDFTSKFWSIFVASITLVGILACLVLLWVTARKKVAPGSDNTTGHVWDEDLREMNNPLPRWWMWLFVLTIVFSLLYLVAFPGLGAYPGQLGWTSAGDYKEEVARLKDFVDLCERLQKLKESGFLDSVADTMLGLAVK